MEWKCFQDIPDSTNTHTNTHTTIHTHVHTHSYVCTLAHTHTQTHTHTYTHSNIHTHTHMHIRTYTHSHVHTHTHTHAHKYAHSYVHTHTHAHTYTHSYIHTHTDTQTYAHSHIPHTHTTQDFGNIAVILFWGKGIACWETFSLGTFGGPVRTELLVEAMRLLHPAPEESVVPSAASAALPHSVQDNSPYIFWEIDIQLDPSHILWHLQDDCLVASPAAPL